MKSRIVFTNLVVASLSTAGCELFADFKEEGSASKQAGGRHSGGDTARVGGAGAGTSSNGGISGAMIGAGGSSIGGNGTLATMSGGAAGSLSSGVGGRTLTDGGSSSIGGTSAGGTLSGGTTAKGGTTPAGGAAAGGATMAGATIGGAATGGVTVGGTTAKGGTTSAGGVAGSTPAAGAATGGAQFSGPPSCEGLATTCQGESCCTSINVPGGTFPMGRSEVTGASDNYPDVATIFPNETPEHSATVASFALDKYEVTVGRFRKFVSNYNAWRTAGNPATNSGAHPIAPYTGWGRSWWPSADDLPADATALVNSVKCNSYNATWKDTPDTNEAYPINCLNWFVAFAFCLWDGGRLPTEAEWEYVAAGGTINTLYPWGSAAPDATRANYIGSDWSPFVPVGSKVKSGGAATWGHADLGGSMYEWVFDWYSSSYYGTPSAPTVCSNCANTTQATQRVVRGGCFLNEAANLRAAFRGFFAPGEYPYYTYGVRCARALK